MWDTLIGISLSCTKSKESLAHGTLFCDLQAETRFNSSLPSNSGFQLEMQSLYL